MLHKYTHMKLVQSGTHAMKPSDISKKRHAYWPEHDGEDLPDVEFERVVARNAMNDFQNEFAQLLRVWLSDELRLSFLLGGMNEQFYVSPSWTDEFNPNMNGTGRVAVQTSGMRPFLISRIIIEFWHNLEIITFSPVMKEGSQCSCLADRLFFPAWVKQLKEKIK